MFVKWDFVRILEQFSQDAKLPIVTLTVTHVADQTWLHWL